MRFPVETVTVNNAKKSGLSLRLKLSGIQYCPNIIKRFLQGISSRTSHFYTAGLTVEAALAFPVFLLAALQLISLLTVFYNYSVKSMSLYESCKKLAEYSYVSEDLPLETEYIDLIDYYKETPKVALIQKNLWFLARARVRVWTGYDNTQNAVQEKCVYITDNQEVYHINLHCSYLDMDIIEITEEEADAGVLKTGNKVTPCSMCVTSAAYIGKYYATESGEHYHYDIECTGLIRRVRMVLKEDAGNIPVCSRCGGESK